MRHRPAVGVTRGGCAGQADEQVAERPEAQAAEGHLEGGHAAGVADQPPPEEVGRDVGGSGATDPDGEVADPAEVLARGSAGRAR